MTLTECYSLFFHRSQYFFLLPPFFLSMNRFEKGEKYFCENWKDILTYTKKRYRDKYKQKELYEEEEEKAISFYFISSNFSFLLKSYHAQPSYNNFTLLLLLTHIYHMQKMYKKCNVNPDDKAEMSKRKFLSCLFHIFLSLFLVLHQLCVPDRGEIIRFDTFRLSEKIKNEEERRKSAPDWMFFLVSLYVEANCDYLGRISCA